MRRYGSTGRKHSFVATRVLRFLHSISGADISYQPDPSTGADRECTVSHGAGGNWSSRRTYIQLFRDKTHPQSGAKWGEEYLGLRSYPLKE
jgi:hypothetical protein